MEYKTYTGETLQEAKRIMRDDAGPDAYIVNQRIVNEKGLKGLFAKPMVEITVGVPQREAEPVVTRQAQPVRAVAVEANQPSAPESTPRKDELMQVVERILRENGQSAPAPEPRRETMAPASAFKPTGVAAASRVDVAAPQTLPASVPEAAPSEVSQQLEALQNRLETLSRELERRPAPSETQAEPDNLLTLALKAHDMPAPFMQKIVRTIGSDLESAATNRPLLATRLAHALTKLLLVDPGWMREPTQPTAIVLVGPTGAGKTSLAGKLASMFTSLHGRRIRVVSTDSFRAGTATQLKIYADILGCPFSRVMTEGEMRESVRRDDYDLLIVDTPGRSPQQQDDLAAMADLIRAIEIDRSTALVMPATARPRDLQQLTVTYSGFEPEAVMTTKMDETSGLGPIIAAVGEAQLPWVFTSYGQGVPRDLTLPDMKKLSQALLEAV